MDFNVLLCIPPDYDYNFPSLGTPALAGFLKKNGFRCDQIDLNLAYRDFLAHRVSGPADITLEERRFFSRHAVIKFFAKNLHSKYYSALLPRNIDGTASDLPYGNNTNSSFRFCERLLSSEYLFRYLEDKDENTFYQSYEEAGLLDEIEKRDVKLLGMSIISPTQAIPSLTLGLLVKRALPHIHVTIGGQWATLYRKEILKKRELFRCFDSLIAFEGETAICELARSLKAGIDIRPVPNIILPDTDPCIEPKRIDENMDLLPCPDFDGLPLKDYNGSDGKLSLTFETSRGCYWSKCAYCVDLPLPKPSYRRKSPALAVADIQELKRKYGAQYLFFGDPGLSPRQMREISQEMIRRGVKMGLWTMARLDPGFDRKLFDLAFTAGFKQINFGFESANDRVCAFLDKGNFRVRSSRIIKDCASAGIKVDLQTMLALPGETFEDALDTIDFLVEHKKFISHVTFNTYYLTPFNYVYQDPSRYGIEAEKDTDLPFRFFTPFRHKDGIDRIQAEILKKMHNTLIKDFASDDAKQASNSNQLNEGCVEFQLNGESCELRYRYDKAADTYTFIEDRKEEGVVVAQA